MEQVKVKFRKMLIELLDNQNGIGPTLYDQLLDITYTLESEGLFADDVLNKVIHKDCHFFLSETDAEELRKV